ncbi:MAG TPA: TlpA disulfide reductase family protein [Thermodesulfovibrionales bacterium]|nr:TlpA disulfide reductase family protein [Thermodesulfovibrionales bacterium]
MWHNMTYLGRRICISFIISLSCFSLAAGDTSSRNVSPEVGKYAPDFELDDVNGRRATLAEFRGKVILLNFWSTSCGPCKEEMPSLNRLYAALQAEGFVVLAISIDTSESPVRSFLSAKSISFPVLMDKDKEVYFDEYAGFGLPTSFLIDKKGLIVEKFIGPREWDSSDIKERVLKLLHKI